MKKTSYIYPVLLAICVVVLVGCGKRPQRIVQPTPHFGWEPPSRSQAKKVNLALVSPNFSSDSSFGSYKKVLI